MQILRGGVLTKEEYLSAEVKVMKEIIKKIAEETRKNKYEVGDVWITRSGKTPTENGFAGTWERIKDQFILAAGDTYKLDAVGGEATHTLAGEEMPTHQHYIATEADEENGMEIIPWVAIATASVGAQSEKRRFVWTGPSGGSKPHNNMPPYRAFNVWLRTA